MSSSTQEIENNSQNLKWFQLNISDKTQRRNKKQRAANLNQDT